MPSFHRNRCRFVLSLYPKNGFGLFAMRSGSRCASTFSSSSPPMLAITAATSGSAKAAWISSARSAGDASAARVVGYSTGTRSNSSRRRLRPSSNGAGKCDGERPDGESTATVSPRAGFGG